MLKMSDNKEIIEKLAKSVRQKINLVEKNVNILDVFTELDIKFEENESNEIVEHVRKESNGEYVISLNRTYDPCSPNDKFKLAHELGHIFLHLNLSNDDIMGSNQAEYDANEFAAHFLMPTNLFLEEICELTNENKIDVDDLATVFGVSYNAALTRGRFLGVFAW